MSPAQIFFSQLNAFFDKVFVITLQRATDRHAHVQKALQGLNYELFYGKDKLEFSVDELKQQGIYNEDLARKHHRYGKPMPPGMIGCSWSHAEVYRRIIRDGYQKTLILEDDVVVDETQVH
ncbi:MAG TPA: glycosyltransferase family 25 protein, partial [Flavisolibacter sp.]|nr:glycosyltransferase family 25 protein [Flavisolibacter sp.]